MEFYNETISNETSKNVTFFSDDVGYNTLSLASLVPSWSIWSLIVFVIIAITIGVPGNSLVLLVLLKVKRKTSTDWFVIFIALCDLISVSVNGTLYIVTFTSELPVTIWANIVCKLHVYIVHFVILESSFLITCVGLDRYFKTCKPHTVFFTPKSSLRSCLITTIVSALFNISHFFTTKLNIYGKCTLDNSKASLRMYMYGVLLAVVICNSGAICVMYSMVAIKIRNRMKVVPRKITCSQSNCDSSERRNTRTKLTMCSWKAVPDYSHSNALLFRSRQRLDSGSKYRISSRRGPVSDNKPNRNMVVSHIPTGIQQTGIGLVLTTSSTRAKISIISDNVLCRDCPSNENKTEGQTAIADVTTLTTIEMNQRKTHQMQYVKEHIQNTGVKLDIRSKQIIKTSKIMVAITVVFILSTVIPTVAVAILTVLKDIKQQKVGRVVIFWLIRLYLVNNITNLIFYIWLSSAFRKRVAETICKIFKK